MSSICALTGHYKGTQRDCAEPCSYYPYALGPCQSYRRIQVADLELGLNPLGPLLAGLPPRGCTNQASRQLPLGERKKNHAQECPG